MNRFTNTTTEATAMTNDTTPGKVDRARRFVLVCGTLLVVVLALGAAVLYSFIPSIEKDPDAVRTAMRELAGNVTIPQGYQPLQVVDVSPLGLVSGRSARFVGPGDNSYVTASLFRKAEDLPGRAELSLTDVTETPITVLGQEQTARIGTLPAENGGAPMRVATVWTRTDAGVLQVMMIAPPDAFDEEAAMTLLRSVGT